MSCLSVFAYDQEMYIPFGNCKSAASSSVMSVILELASVKAQRYGYLFKNLGERVGINAISWRNSSQSNLTTCTSYYLDRLVFMQRKELLNLYRFLTYFFSY